jgi:hypothetical protein
MLISALLGRDCLTIPAGIATLTPFYARSAPWSIFTAGRPSPMEGRRSPFRVIGYRNNVLMWSGKLSKADLDRLAYWEKSNATTAAAT